MAGLVSFEGPAAQKAVAALQKAQQRRAGFLPSVREIAATLFAGGRATNEVLPIQYRTAEYLWRKAPEEAMFAPVVAPNRPFQFELGATAVDRSSVFWILDYEFRMGRPSGIDPDDIVYSEEGRGSGFLGWDITVNGQRLNTIRFELDPSPAQLSREQYASGVQPQAAAFNRAQFNSFAVTAGPGLSLLPVRSEVMGARGVPFCIVAPPASRVALGCVLFRPVTFPVSFFEGRVAGYHVPSDLSDRVLRQISPP